MSEWLRIHIEKMLQLALKKKPDARNFVVQADIDADILAYKKLLGDEV